MAPYRIVAFTESNLQAALSNTFCRPDEVVGQSRADYLFGYLKDLGVQTIVVEEEYTDGDYLEDFASYYVRCFQTYERRCKRLHFFAADLATSKFEAMILAALPQAEMDELRESYCGFVVARPLPSAIVGRSVLRTYPSDSGRRNYPVTKDYVANLFGVDFRVRSLAYQEQDTVLAACATVALWSAFHKTADLFGTSAPRPAEITRAGNSVADSQRPIPSHGLSLLQMAHAIRTIGLESETIEARPNIPLVSLAYAHLRMGLPVVLVVDVEGTGLHAITLTGYSLRKERVNKKEVAGNETSIPMKGLRIDQFYGHDDQIGPFARLHIGPSAKEHPVIFEGQWMDQSSKQRLALRPQSVLIPVYNKIRVTFIDILKWLERLHAVLSLVLVDSTALEWDVHLTTLSEFKQEFKSTYGTHPQLLDILTAPQPRFIWRAGLSHGGQPVCELHADATDMERSFPFFRIVWYDTGVQDSLKSLLQAPDITDLLKQTLRPRLFDLLAA